MYNNIHIKPQSRIKRFWMNFKENRLAILCAALFALICLLSILAPVIANDKPIILKYQHSYYFPIIKNYPETTFNGVFPTITNYQDPVIQHNILKQGWMIFPPLQYAENTANLQLNQPVPSPPSSQNLLGTDNQGRDVLARLLYGVRLSLFFAVTLTILSTIIGIVIGALQGYFAGWLDLIGQRLIEIWLGLPYLFIIMIIVSLFRPSLWIFFLIMLSFNWMIVANLVRTEVLRIRKYDYIRSAQVLGFSNTKILFSHILPNALSSTLSQLPFLFTAQITAITALDFLGYGLPVGSASLGELLQQARNHLDAPWLVWSSCLTLLLILTLLIYLGEACRDALDPHQYKTQHHHGEYK
ncbi:MULTISPECIES: ABC transporter permease [unclassified Acinetobacter]|uniref:ABC transporter permease n=1 Tax=unclassified Acinetobacter TaxID=196816 RepID=UPI0035B97875